MNSLKEEMRYEVLGYHYQDFVLPVLGIRESADSPSWGDMAQLLRDEAGEKHPMAHQLGPYHKRLEEVRSFLLKAYDRLLTYDLSGQERELVSSARQSTTAPANGNAMVRAIDPVWDVVRKYVHRS